LFKTDLNFTKKINPFEDNLEKLASPVTKKINPFEDNLEKLTSPEAIRNNKLV